MYCFGKISRLNQQGCEALEKGKWKRAIEQFTKAIDIDNKNAILIYNRSLAYQKAERYGEAKDDASSLYECDCFLSKWQVFVRNASILLYFDIEDALYTYKQGLVSIENDEFGFKFQSIITSSTEHFYRVFDRLQGESNCQTFWKDINNYYTSNQSWKFTCDLYFDKGCHNLKLIFLFCDGCVRSHLPTSFIDDKSKLPKIFRVLFDPNLQPGLDLTQLTSLLKIAISAFYQLGEFKKCVQLGQKCIEAAREHGAGFNLLRSACRIISQSHAKIGNEYKAKLYWDISMNLHRLSEFRTPKSITINVQMMLSDIVKIIDGAWDEELGS